MTEYSTLNVKLSNSELNKLKSALKNGTEITFKFFNKFDQAFANGSSANIKLSNNQLCKIGQSGGFSGRV